MPEIPDECPFCAIVAGTATAQMVASVPGSIAIRPLNPVAPGHVLVLPTAHVRDAAEDPDITAAVMRHAAVLAPVVTSGQFNLITSAGPAATQSVFHLHVHIVPRSEGDGLALPWADQRESAYRAGREDQDLICDKQDHSMCGDRCCQQCNARNIVWFTGSPLWNTVMDPDRDAVLCVRCFVLKAEALGIGKRGAWKLTTEFPREGPVIGYRYVGPDGKAMLFHPADITIIRQSGEDQDTPEGPR